MLVCDKLHFEMTSVDELGVWCYIEDDPTPTLFSPTQNMRDAWYIAEKVDGHVTLQKFNDDTPQYYAIVNHNDGKSESGWVSSPSEAICLAVLKAEGVDVG